MIKSPLVWTIKNVIIGVILLSIQQALSTYVHKYFELIDIFILFFILILFTERNEDLLKWLFITGFILGIAKGMIISQKLGIASFFYMVFAYHYAFYKSISKTSMQLVLFSLLAFVYKFVVYIILAFIFKDDDLMYFLLSKQFLQQIAFTVVFIIGVGIPTYWIINRIRRDV